MKALVLGGGIAGVTTAYFLGKDGHDVTLLEANEQLGLEATASNAGIIAPGHSFAWGSPKAPAMLWRSLLRHDRVVAEQLNAVAIEQLRAWIANGGTVLFGTDVGAVGYDPADEYAAMAQAGMSCRQILASLTTAPAQVFGDRGRAGRVAAGFAADLVVLECADLPTDARRFAAVRHTLRAGRVIRRGAAP